VKYSGWLASFLKLLIQLLQQGQKEQ